VQGNYTFAIVAVEYFTKWVEVNPVTNITSGTIKKIMTKYHLSLQNPQQIIVNNVKYFDYDVFKDLCHQVSTKVDFASVYHMQSNGMAERATP
jgi:hypothetical protein